jgi:serine/threonine-protein kinase
VVLVCLVAGGILAGRSVGSPAAATRPAAVPSPHASGAAPSPVRVHVAPEELIGRPVGLVQARLAALGLQVAVRSTPTSTVPADAVVRLDPVGDLPLGEWVTLTYATAPVVTPSTDRPATGTPAVAPPSPAATAVPTSGPARGVGPGRGHGHGRHG